MAPTARAQETHVTADFAVAVDYPLVKTKFGVFNSGMVRPNRYARDIHLYNEVNPDSLRIDLGWGARWIGWKPEPVSGTADHLHFDFHEMDRIASLLRSRNVLAYWSYCYTPPPLQPGPGDYRGTPTDPNAWATILRTMAEHYRNFPGGDPVGYHEICNEPDNRIFFTGGLDEYLKMYRIGSQAIRAGNPDALVGGPALAFSNSWINPFLDAVMRDRLPLDFFSFHYYPGCPYTPPDLHGVVKLMIDSLGKRPALRTTELHLNEFNSFRIDYPRGGTQDRIPIASAFLHDLAWFLTQPALTRVYWAQFQDSGGGNYSGMIDIDGHRKALFNAYAAYARMPVDRDLLSIDSPTGIEGFASSDDRREAVLIWNRSGSDRDVELKLLHRKTTTPLRVFRIDTHHASRGDGSPSERLTEDPVDHGQPAGWFGNIPRDGIVLIEAGDNSPPESPPQPLGHIVRELHDYPDRASRAYADFDRNTWIARLGMAGETRAIARVGVIATGLPDKIFVTVEPSGGIDLQHATHSFSIRIDYETAHAYARAVLFHGPDSGTEAGHGSSTGSAIPWGTKRDAEQVIALSNLARFPIEIARYAPPGWTGRVELTFTLENAGPTSRIIVRLGR